MKALVYERAHTLDAFSIELRDVVEPALRNSDVLVEIKAIGINPGEAFFRRTRSARPGGYVLLGWEFSGVVIEVGPGVQGFSIGDRVFGTGDVSRDGCWAERLAVDHRILAKIPSQLSFADAASLPIGALTAWEAMFRDHDALPKNVQQVLVVGGAGAVGSLATQILKARTKAFVISSGAHSDSRAWCSKMGADLVIDHGRDIVTQLAAANVQSLDMVLSTAGINENIGWIAQMLRPFGHVAIVDLTPSLDLSVLNSKSASVHIEMVFSRVIHGCDRQSQGRVLEMIGSMVADKRMQSIATTRLSALSVASMKEAHELIETRRNIGKVVIEI